MFRDFKNTMQTRKRIEGNRKMFGVSSRKYLKPAEMEEVD